MFEIESDHVGFTEQRRMKSSGEWTDCGYYYWLARAHPELPHGYTAVQYDGCHEAMRLGPVCATWSNSYDGTDREWPWTEMWSAVKARLRQKTTEGQETR